MRCASCGSENPAGAKFCNECAAPFMVQCPSCGVSNRAGAKFCSECAAALVARGPEAGTSAASRSFPRAEQPNIIVGTPVTHQSAAQGERKTITALFADIKGSTGLEENLDPEEARAIVDPALNLMIEATRRYDGYVVQSTGDGIFALFGAPIAHEDHPQRALYAALRMLEDIKRYDEVLLGNGRGPVEIRVGVNTGEVVVRSIETGNGQVEYTPIGHTANLASRMQTLAATGSIAITENTRRLVEGYFALKARGPTRIKGVSEPVQVYEVTGLGPLRTRLQRSAGRGLTKFVGRAREMEMMKATAQLAKEGRGQIVAAVAEAGVGKSRLFYEFKAVSQSGWLVLEAFSISHGKASAYLPVIEMLHAYFDITPADEARRRREKIGGKVLMLDRSLEDTLPYLFSLLGANEGEDSGGTKDPQIRERRTLDAIKRLLLRESLNQPLILIFEDLHWVDAKTLALLNMLADSIGTAKILLLVNYRPEYSHSWGGKTFYTRLRLDPLHKENAEEMISALLGDDAQLAELKRLIIEKTEGNPFFMEEMVQVLLDEGALVRNETLRLTKPLNELKIPPTVQGILAARIDRLPQAAKDLLQTLAVIGKEFPLYLVRAVTGMSDGQHARPPLAMRGERPLNDTAEAQLDALLSHLQLGEFIYEQPAQGDIEYTFKHALTQEVAYNSVLIERRRMLHERTARAIEQLLSGHSDNHLNELAHHYSRSGNAEKAAEYLQRAGESAMKRWGSIDEAISHLSAAMDLVRAMPETPAREQRETDLRMALRALLLYRDE